MANWFTRKADEMREHNDRAIRRQRAALDANQRAREGEERVMRHLGRTFDAYKGICPVCECRVKGQVQRQEAIVSCSCGHTVTLAQWQQNN
jgi:ferric-dicitrate binding protein FerR (iron transport regulator)